MLTQSDGTYSAITHDDALAHFTDDGFLTDWNPPIDMDADQSSEAERKLMLAVDEVFINLGLQKGTDAN